MSVESAIALWSNGLAKARTAARSTCVATKSAIASRMAPRRGSSPACTSPRCRSGRASVSERGSAPTTVKPACVNASAARRRWRSLATRFRTMPPTRTRGFERIATLRNGCGGLRLPAHVEDQQDRQAKPGGEVGGGASRAGRRRDAVEQSHRAFADHEVAVVRRATRQQADELRRHRPRIEVEARAAGRGGMEGWVDVIRPILDAGDADAVAGERPHQSEGQDGLAAAGFWRCDEETAGREVRQQARRPAASRARVRRCGQAGTRGRRPGRSRRRSRRG